MPIPSASLAVICSPSSSTAIVAENTGEIEEEDSASA